MDIQLKPLPRLQNFSSGIDSDLGLMDYGLMYRIFGPLRRNTRLAWQEAAQSLDVYAGARTIWLENSVSLTGPRGLVRGEVSAATASPARSWAVALWSISRLKSSCWWMATSADSAPERLVHRERLGAGGLPDDGVRCAAVHQAGWKALRYELDQAPLQTKATLNGRL